MSFSQREIIKCDSQFPCCLKSEATVTVIETAHGLWYLSQR